MSERFIEFQTQKTDGEIVYGFKDILNDTYHYTPDAGTATAVCTLLNEMAEEIHELKQMDCQKKLAYERSMHLKWKKEALANAKIIENNIDVIRYE